MRVALFVLAFSAASIFSADSDLEKLKAELIDKDKASRSRLISGLKREETAAQSKGDLALLLSIKERLAYLENSAAANPFQTSKDEETDSGPVQNSQSEKIYFTESRANRKTFNDRLTAYIQQLEQKQKSATKAGKIDEALSLEGAIADLKQELIAELQNQEQEPTGVRVGSAIVFDITELKVVSSKVGYSELGINKSPDGVHFPRINGVVPKKYICGHASHSIVYKIPSGVLKFEATGQRADDRGGSIKLSIKIDGKKVWEGKEMSRMDEAEKVIIDIPIGSKTIELLADPMGAIVNDYACWIEPKFWKK